jgi:CubicO group peptidase (beta-lactamase class C family)
MKKNRLFILLMLGWSTLFAQSKTEQIDGLLKHYANAGFLNGAALVAESGKVVYRSAYGIGNQEWQIPHQVEGVFQIYSLSKQFTAVLMLQLVQEGKVSLDHPIVKYLPDYPPEVGNKVLVKHTLCHAHGIAMPNWEAIPFSSAFNLDTFVNQHLAGGLMFEPGQGFHYGSVGRGHVIAAAIIQKVTGKEFETVLHERLLDPLGMSHSGLFHHEDVIPGYVGSYRKQGDRVSQRLDLSLIHI